MYFGGIDAHLTYLTIAVVDRAGEVMLQEWVATTEPSRVLEVLAPYRPLKVVVETCPFWPWIHDLVVPAGISFHLAHAKELEAIANSTRKTDTRDAALLGRMLAAGLIPEVYPKPAPQRETLKLLRHRAILVRQRTSLANRIHAQLHQARLALPREALLRKKARGWLKSAAWPQLATEQRELVITHLKLIDVLTPMIHALDKRIARLARHNAAVAVLETIPGIGPYRGLLLATELSPITHFSAPEHLVSYAGLAPVTRSSGGHTRRGSIPKEANRWVRGALVSAIPRHVRAAPESTLSKYYGRLKERLGWRVARVATARKLVHCIYPMLRSGEAWRG